MSISWVSIGCAAKHARSPVLIEESGSTVPGCVRLSSLFMNLQIHEVSEVGVYAMTSLTRLISLATIACTSFLSLHPFQVASGEALADAIIDMRRELGLSDGNPRLAHGLAQFFDQVCQVDRLDSYTRTESAFICAVSQYWPRVQL